MRKVNREKAHELLFRGAVLQSMDGCLRKIVGGRFFLKAAPGGEFSELFSDVPPDLLVGRVKEWMNMDAYFVVEEPPTAMTPGQAVDALLAGKRVRAKNSLRDDVTLYTEGRRLYAKTDGSAYGFKVAWSDVLSYSDLQPASPRRAVTVAEACELWIRGESKLYANGVLYESKTTFSSASDTKWEVEEC